MMKKVIRQSKQLWWMVGEWWKYAFFYQDGNSLLSFLPYLFPSIVNESAILLREGFIIKGNCQI